MTFDRYWKSIYIYLGMSFVVATMRLPLFQYQ
jgi:hypothetical protein